MRWIKRYLRSRVRPKSLASVVAFASTRWPSDHTASMINPASCPHESLGLLPQQVHHGQGLLVGVQGNGSAAHTLTEVVGLWGGERVASVALVEKRHDIVSISVYVIWSFQGAATCGRHHGVGIGPYGVDRCWSERLLLNKSILWALVELLLRPWPVKGLRSLLSRPRKVIGLRLSELLLRPECLLRPLLLLRRSSLTPSSKDVAKKSLTARQANHGCQYNQVSHL